MLKSVSITTLIVAATFAIPVYAQSDSSQNLTYVQKAEKMLTQSTAQAKNQFDKTYPKPPPPVIPNSATANAASTPPPVTPHKPKNTNPPPSDDNTNPQPVVNPPPDINVNTGKNPQGQGLNSAQQNIFMPQGSNESNSNSSAPNPYR